MKKNILLIVLFVIIVGLVSYIYVFGISFEKENNQLKQEVGNNTKYTQSDVADDDSTSKTESEMPANKYMISDVAGYYEVIVGSGDNRASYSLNLWADGTFKYSLIKEINSGYIGNYYIDDNDIILNYWFRLGNDATHSVVDGGDSLEIIDTNNLVDNSLDSDLEKITLVRTKNEHHDNYNMTKQLLGAAFCNDCILDPESYFNS